MGLALVFALHGLAKRSNANAAH